MGGILNPNIILDSKPAQIQDPTALADGISRLEQLRQQNALAPLRAQQLQNEVTQGQQQVNATNQTLADQGTAKQILVDNGGDYDKARPLMEGKVGPALLNKMDTDHLTLVKTLADKKATDRKQITDNSDFLGRELNSLILAPDDDRQAAWEGTKQRVVDAGILKPNDPLLTQNVPSVDVLKQQLAHTTYFGQAAKIADVQAQEQQRLAAAAKQKAADYQAALQNHREEAADFFLGLPPSSDPTAKAAYTQRIKDYAALPDQDPNAPISHAQFAKQYLQSIPYSNTAMDTIQRLAIPAKERAQLAQKANVEQTPEEHAAHVYGTEVMGALREVGAKDITNPTSSEMKQARAKVAQQKLAEKKSGAADNPNPLGIPGWIK